MSLQTIEINGVKIVFDKEKTENHRTDFNNPCICQYCRNFYKNIENNIQLIDFLSGFGIDYLRHEEVMSYDLGNEKDSLIHSTAYYCVYGKISESVSIRKCNATISFCLNEDVVGHEIPEEYFFIVVKVDLPFVLDEEREIAPISFMEKVFYKIKGIFKKK